MNDPAAQLLAQLLLAAILLTTGLRLWLATRHLRHVQSHAGAVPQAFSGAIPLDAHRKAADYTAARVRLGRINVAVDALLLAVFTLGGGLQWLYDVAALAFAPGGYAHGLALFALVSLVSGAVDLPFSVYRVFAIEQRFGFNKMTPALFVADLVKGMVIAAAIGAPLLLLVLWLMDAMGGLWWLWVWAVWLAFNVLAMVLYPTLIAPLFNKFSPLDDAGLKARIEALLARCGFRSSGLFVMDGSKRSSHGNAYFTGFGAAKRIVFFDTLIARLAPTEIEAVLAHELGHYKHRHIVKRIALLAAASLALLALLGWLIGEPWFYAGLGMQAQGTAPALILFSLVLPVFLFPLSPVTSWISRSAEFEADAYAAKQTNAGDLISALVKLYRDNAATLTPDPLYSTFYDSHPPAALRVARLRLLEGGAS